jgi:hypothetical protein
VPDDDRWPPYARGRRVRQCLGTVFNEEWAHHGFCVRDLDKLSGQTAPDCVGALDHHPRQLPVRLEDHVGWHASLPQRPEEPVLERSVLR